MVRKVNEKLKILVVNEFYHPVQMGGAEVSVQLLAEKFYAMGHCVYILCSSEECKNELVNNIQVFRVNGNPVAWNGETKKLGKLKKILWHIADIYNPIVKKKISKIIKDVNPGVIFTNNIAHLSCSVWNAAKENHIPVVHTLRDYNLLCPKRTLWNNHKCCERICCTCKFFSIANKMFSQKVDAVVGISNHILQRHLQEGYFLNSERRVIFNSVNSVNTQNKQSKSLKIGYLGKIHESKGVEVLIKAFSLCENTKYSLLLAGAGETSYIEHLREIIGNKKNIHFCGKVNRDSFFKDIDLLVVPSIWEEPFGRTVIEAVAANVPVIAARSGGISEILVGHDVGKLYEPSSIFELKELLNDFMKGLVKFDFSAKEAFIERFSQNVIAKQYIDLFQFIKNKPEKTNNGQ